MRSVLFVALAVALAGGVVSVTPEAAAKAGREAPVPVEGSMVLNGEVRIGTEGQVEGFTLDQREKVPADIADFVDRSVQTWRFEPIVREGKPVHAKTLVAIRMVAKSNAEGNDVITLESASFGGYDRNSTEQVVSLKLQPPVFPSAAADMGGRGEVIVIVQVGRDGKVMDVVTEQVNLRVRGDQQQMNRLRELFARYTANSARRWTFRAPTTGADKDAPYWTVRVPVNYDFSDSERNVGYGQWNIYIPGPRTQATWRSAEQRGKDTYGPLAVGGVYMADASNGPRLLTPLGG